MTTETTATIHDPTVCKLGEGPLWHPERGQLFWFDILDNRLHMREGGETRSWRFDENVSAAARVSRDVLMIASETKLFTFDIETGATEDVIALEADDATTRSNDGRADPQGGFWIGTMDKMGARPVGKIYRFHKGELRALHDVTIPNAMCFSPDGSTAYFADTPKQRVMRQRLDADGWPAEEPEVHLDLRGENLLPDGAVVDAEGCVWLAEFNSSRVCRYAPDGTRLHIVHTPGATETTCPALGGGDLYIVTGWHNMSEAERAAHPNHGRTFRAPVDAPAQDEHRVIA